MVTIVQQETDSGDVANDGLDRSKIGQVDLASQVTLSSRHYLGNCPCTVHTHKRENYAECYCAWLARSIITKLQMSQTRYLNLEHHCAICLCLLLYVVVLPTGIIRHVFYSSVNFASFYAKFLECIIDNRSYKKVPAK